MSPEQAQRFLQTLAQHWRRKIYAGYALRAAGLAVILGAGAGALFNWPGLIRAWLGIAVFTLSFSIAFFSRRKKLGEAAQIARHLNRVRPELEESCELALKPEAALTALEKMQRERLLQALHALRGQWLLPRHVLQAPLKFLGVSCAIAVLAAIVAPLLAPKKTSFHQSTMSFPAAPTVQNSIATPALKITLSRINILPPVYTGKAPRQQDQFDLNVEAGAQIIWHLTSNQELASGFLILNEKDTLNVQPSGAMAYQVKTQAVEPGFYSFVMQDTSGGVWRSDYYKLEVIKDEAPVITITRPEQRSEIAPGQSLLVNLQAVAEDDYALVRAQIIATLARGSGEAVKFREDTLAFGSLKKESPRRWSLNETLDLQRLGMTPGDELYFFVEVSDNREPKNNRSRSETFFILLKDTARVQFAAGTGLTINPLPEYFRSQRQIIIDTEKLIAEKHQISATTFKNRSNNLGIDQQALRLRYGEFLGEESNSGINRGMEYGAEADEHDKPELRPKTEKENATLMSAVEQFMHDHDAEENATKLAQSVKAMLRAALAEMWEAELHLRTYRPEAALPFEYRALKLLKEVQQQSRVYVQRAGFEPTPIKVAEKRLSGDLSKIANRRAHKDFPESKTLPNVRQALLLLQNLKSRSHPVKPEELEILEKAGQDLARLALEQPGRHLHALQSLRKLLISINSPNEFCGDCIAAVEPVLWNLLPLEKPAPNRQPTVDFGLSRLYFKKMEAAR